MVKSILYRWFGSGKPPKRYRSDIKKEGVIFQDKGLSIVLRDSEKTNIPALLVF